MGESSLGGRVQYAYMQEYNFVFIFKRLVGLLQN